MCTNIVNIFVYLGYSNLVVMKNINCKLTRILQEQTSFHTFLWKNNLGLPILNKEKDLSGKSHCLFGSFLLSQIEFFLTDFISKVQLVYLCLIGVSHTCIYNGNIQ